MIRSLRTAEKAMQREQVRIAALANNLANANTTGFRQVLTRVSEAKEQEAVVKRPVDRQGGGGSRDWRPVPEVNLGHALDARGGPIRATGRETDLAIRGRGYFVVQTPDGERYTRNGSFRVDEQRRLVTADGKPLLGDGGPLVLAGDSFGIEEDGTVVVGGNPAGRIRVVDFPEPARLEHQGANLLLAPPDMAAQAVPPAEAAMVQGHLEGSNVNPIDTLVGLIAAQRAFELQAKVLTTEDELLNKSVNNLPRVGG